MPETDPDRRCRGCNVPHADQFDPESSGGVGRLLPWVDGWCPVCLDRRGERRRWGAWHVVAARIDPTDDYLAAASDAAQMTLEEAFGR